MSIDVQQPRPYDLVADTIQIAGTAGGAFEANYEYEITEGHDHVSGHFMAGDGVGGHGQFQVAVETSGAGFTLPSATLHVFHSSARDGSRLDEIVVPIVLGSQIVPGYTVYDEYVVQSGDTLWAIADRAFGDGAQYPRLVAANPHTITDPDHIDVGQVVRIPR